MKLMYPLNDGLQLAEDLGTMLALSQLGVEELIDSLDRLHVTPPDAPHAFDRDQLVWRVLDRYFASMRSGECAHAVWHAALSGSDA